LHFIVLVAYFIIVFYRITVIGWSALSCCKPLLSDIIIIIIYTVTVHISLDRPITLQLLEVSLVLRVFPKEKYL